MRGESSSAPGSICPGESTRRAPFRSRTAAEMSGRSDLRFIRSEARARADRAYAGPVDASLAALARKYRTLAEVRRDKLRSGARTPREAMRALAREFPGSLRELDVLPLEELDRRAAAL